MESKEDSWQDADEHEFQIVKLSSTHYYLVLDCHVLEVTSDEPMQPFVFYDESPTGEQ